MRRALGWAPLLAAAAFLVVAGCGDGEAEVAETAAVAAPADLSGVAVEVHQAPG